MTDYLNGLNLSQEPERVDDESYVAPKVGGFKPIKRGTYLARQIDGEYGSDKVPVEFGETRNGFLSAALAFEIIDIGGESDGRKLKYMRVNTSPYVNAKDEKRRKMNSALDYLVAVGWKPSQLNSNAAYAAALTNSIGKLVKLTVDGDAYCGECQTSFYWDNFPSDGNGSFETEMPCPNHDGGAAPIIKIRNVIRRYSALTEKELKTPR